MDSIKKLPIWVVWKAQIVPSASDKIKNTRTTKVPYQISGKHASSIDPTHWVTYEEAENAASRFSGIGFTISKNYPLLCIDLDHCLDKNGNLLRDDFDFLIEAADTYVETSPSGDGLHIILELEKHFSLVSNKKVYEDGIAVEAYTEGRYFTFTGKPFGTEKPVRKVSHEVADELLRMVGYPWGKKVKTTEKVDAKTINLDLSDEMVLDKMFKSKGGYDIEKLHGGDTSKHNDDNSAADASFCMHLAFWTQKNPAQMKRIWRASPLGQREKTKTRDDYVDRTIENAIEKCTKVYSPAPLIKEDATAEPELVREINYSTNHKGKPYINAYNITQIMLADSSLCKSFRFNEFSHEHEANVRTSRDFTPLQKDDVIFTMIYIQKTYTFFEKVTKSMVEEAVINVAHTNPVNPPVDLIKSVEWDKTDRIAHWLHHTFGVEDTEVYQAIASNWLKGLVNRVISPGCKFDTVLVLEGEQGIGKSTALRALADPWYAETTMDIDTKDFQLILTQNIVVEFSEGASLSRSASAAMKQKITDQEDNFRKPYDRTSQKYPRHCVFAMTTNEEQYLKDHTGNRRWLPVALPNLPANIAWLKENRLQLFAEAYHRVYELEETTYEFPKEELNQLQAARLEEDPWISKIAAWYYDQLTDLQREEGVTTTDAYEVGIHKGQYAREIRPGENHRISSILSNFLHLEKKRSVVNKIRAYRYHATTVTIKLGEERLKTLTTTEQAERRNHQDWKSMTAEAPSAPPVKRAMPSPVSINNNGLDQEF